MVTFILIDGNAISFHGYFHAQLAKKERYKEASINLPFCLNKSYIYTAEWGEYGSLMRLTVTTSYNCNKET